MSRYIIRRVLMMAPLLLGVSVLGYALVNLAPGDPVSMLVSPEVGGVSANDLTDDAFVDAKTPRGRPSARGVDQWRYDRRLRSHRCSLAGQQTRHAGRLAKLR